jgi:hypothetical protein
MPMRHPVPQWPLVGLCILSGLVLFPRATAASGIRDTGTCAASPIHTARYSRWSAAPRIPWIETKNHRIAGFLFFAGNGTGPEALLHTHGQMPNGSATKILWYVRVPGGSRRLTLTGRRLGGEDRVRQDFSEVSPPKNYPSIVTIPVAGCWKLSLRSGSVRGTVVMRVVDAASIGGQQLPLALTLMTSSSPGGGHRRFSDAQSPLGDVDRGSNPNR